jgi:regulator of RNase E activity RraA
MPVVRKETSFRRLPPDLIDAWRRIDTSIATDVLHRSQAMGADIKPLAPGMRICGRARTVATMVGDSSATHVACSLIEAGEVLVMNAGGYLDTASWGGNAARFLMKRGAAGFVTDGAVRDAAEIRGLGFPVFCRGVVPRGPHKGYGGIIDGVTAVGSVSVAPGDLILGDDDGIVVVPLAKAKSALRDAEALVAKEGGWPKAIEGGRSMAEILGLKVDIVEPGP